MKHKINRFVENQWDKDQCCDLVTVGLVLTCLAVIGVCYLFFA